MYYFNKFLIFFVIIFNLFCINKAFNKNVQLMTTSNNFMSMISGFTARIQCSLYACGLKSTNDFPSVNLFFNYLYIL